MKTFTTLAVAGLITLSGGAFSAQALERVRGTIEKADGGMVTIKTVDGEPRPSMSAAPSSPGW